MKILLFAIALSITPVLSYPTNTEEEYDENEWEMIPDENGNLYLVKIKDIDYDTILMSDNNVKFLLYTGRNPTNAQEITPNDANSLLNSNFNFNNGIRFLIHGWRSSGNGEINVEIRNAYLSRGDFNIIVVDWSSAAKYVYTYAQAQVSKIGLQVSTLMDFLSKKGASYDDICCVGHSLGAHICGFAGKLAKEGRINTIFGLDVARPLFDMKKPSNRLNIGDAKYVQTIHTDAGRLGFEHPIGDASFYPSWGSNQSGCSILDISGTCSHSRSYLFFSETLRNPNQFIGKKCGDLNNIKERKCQNLGVIAPMGGEPSNPEIKGIFYLRVSKQKPYGMGNTF